MHHKASGTPQVFPDRSALLARFEWKHLQISARRHAREQERRHVVIGIKNSIGGWDYMITPQNSALHANHQLQQERELLDKLREQECALTPGQFALETWQRHCPHPGVFRGQTCYACGAVA